MSHSRSDASEDPLDPTLELLLGTVLDAAIVIRADGTVCDWNNAAETTFGWRKNEADGQILAQLIIPHRYRELHRQGMENFFKTGHGPLLGRRIEVSALRKSGEEFPIELSISPILRGSDSLFVGFARDISERQQHERDLAESRARLALASSAAALGIWDWDVTANRMIYSDRAQEIYGFETEHEIDFDTVRDATHPEDLPRTMDMARQALDPAIRLKTPYEYRIIRPGGEVRWVVAHGEAIFEEADGETRALRYVGTIQDVTDAKLVEQSLRDSEARLRLAMGAARMAVWEVDMRTNRVIDPSPDLKRMVGIPVDEPFDLDWVRSRYAPGERERVQAISMQQMARGDDFIESDFRYVMPDGSDRTLLLRATVHVGDDKLPSRVVGVLLDITEQKRAEAALRESEARRQRAQEAGGIGDWTLDVGSGELSFSDEFANLLGRDPSDLPWASIGLVDFIHPDDFHALMRKLAALRSGRRDNLDAEYRIIRPDGQVRWLAARAEGERDEAGNLLRIAGVSFDITPRREAEDAVRRMNETLEAQVAARTAELETANRNLSTEAAERERVEQALRQTQKMEAIGQLTGGVAHDFNNLLMAVLSNLDLLRKLLPPEPRIDRHLEGAIQGARRGAALTQRLLAFARRQDLKVQPVDLAALVTGMEDLLSKSTGPGIETTLDIAERLPPALADPNQIELALLNLVVNARDAMPDGGRLTIGLTRESAAGDDVPPGEYLRLAVTDTGAGMDEETLKRAVEPFFSTKEIGKGTGLGLSMIHGLAEQLGGRFQLFSEPGQGTRAELWLPAASRLQAVASVTPQQPAARAEAAPATILYVDDDALVAMGTVDMLADLGHTVLEANSGVQALEMLRARPEVDLLITDHSMPGMTGVQLAKAAREFRPELPILLATGYADVTEAAELKLPRLTKPFMQRQLATEIAKLLPEPAGAD